MKKKYSFFLRRITSREIAKKSEVISIDQTPNEEWVVVYSDCDKDTWQLILHSCKRTYKGTWHAALQAE